ncbi:MAG: hypothetical protein SFW08_10680 [Gemmatimonadaceae bacterium]|nr:hypothetical protein [Gemmatimonadaceae bacterium]
MDGPLSPFARAVTAQLDGDPRVEDFLSLLPDAYVDARQVLADDLRLLSACYQNADLLPVATDVTAATAATLILEVAAAL